MKSSFIFNRNSFVTSAIENYLRSKEFPASSDILNSNDYLRNKNLDDQKPKTTEFKFTSKNTKIEYRLVLEHLERPD